MDRSDGSWVHEEAKRDEGAIPLLLMSFWPIGVLIAEYLLTPGYIIPLLNHPVARLFIIGATLWLLVGSVCMRRFQGQSQRALIQLFFNIPVALFFMLGSAVTVIFNAMLPELPNLSK